MAPSKKKAATATAATGRTRKSNNLESNGNKGRAGKKIASAISRKTKRGGKKHNGGKSGTAADPARIEDDIELNDGDLEYFGEHSGSFGFLEQLDERALLHGTAKTPSEMPIVKRRQEKEKSATKSAQITAKMAQAAMGGSNGGEMMLIDGSDDDEDDNMRPVKRVKKGKQIEDGKFSKNSKVNDIGNFERQPRVGNREFSNEEGPTRLPIKTGTGCVVQVSLSKEDQQRKKIQDNKRSDDHCNSVHQGEDANIDEVSQDIESENMEAPSDTNTVSALTSLSPVQLREFIAKHCMDIIADPTSNVRLMAEVLVLIENPSLDTPQIAKICKLAILSLLSVFRDVLPGYRLRIVTDKERSAKISKDVRVLRDYEEALLRFYQRFLRSLDMHIKKYSASAKKHRKLSAEVMRNRQRRFDGIASNDGEVTANLNELTATLSKQESMAAVCVRCLCEMLISKPHFNYRTNILTTLIPLGASKDSVAISDAVCKCLSGLFKEMTNYSITLEATRFIAQLLKARHFVARPEIVDTFLNLTLHDDVVAAMREFHPVTNAKLPNKGKGQPYVSKKKRKSNKIEAQLESELKEAESKLDTVDRRRMQTETLKMIFLTYFRVLKTAPASGLVSSVLRGLGKFAHLINIDFFSDLMTVLHGLIKKATLGPPSTLRCITTVFQIATGQGEALNVDLKVFYHEFFRMLPLLVGENEQHLPLAFHCVQLMLHRRREVSLDRVCAFIKRLSTLSLHLKPHGELGCLACVRLLMLRYPKAQLLLDADETGLSYAMDVEDPEHCNASCASLWELGLLRRHYHPTVSSFATHVEKGAPGTGDGALNPRLTRPTPGELYHAHDASMGGFEPSIQLPRKHPFEAAYSKNPKAQLFHRPTSLHRPEMLFV